MPKVEPVNIYVTYLSKIRWSNCIGNPGLTYLNQISKYMNIDKTVRFWAEEIANYANDKQLWNLSIAEHKLPAWWWWWILISIIITIISLFVIIINVITLIIYY